MQNPHTFQYPLRVVPVSPTQRSESAANTQAQAPRPAATGPAPAPRRA
jgi:hypothetical protein